MMEKYCLGIDVDKHTFKVCLVTLQVEHKRILGSRTFPNSLVGFKELTTWVSKKLKGKSTSYVMEATGVYHEHLAYYLHEREQSIHIVLPTRKGML